MAEFTDLSEIWFVVSPQNPLKKKSILLPDFHRLEMVKLALADYPIMKISDIEFRLPKPSYTLDTLSVLKKENPDRQFIIIMGTDNLEHFHEWKNFRDLQKNEEFYIFPRLNTANDALKNFSHARIIDAPVIEISSSFIRKSLQEGRDVRFLLSNPVYDYLINQNLLPRK
jgi:nicotinate-nucleotide adenylyltransferase